ncbi:Mobile element protein [hydrothermal vent metagenome]|uniref:Mobile element protein n=1 Tax=hydrothermal vent metagenome TaxID=652676 RepID=A0A3B0S001_9ZZZZ
MIIFDGLRLSLLDKEIDMPRFDLTDFEWGVIQPLLPNKSRGVSRVEDRRVLNGIFAALVFGSGGCTLARTGRIFPLATVPTRPA